MPVLVVCSVSVAERIVAPGGIWLRMSSKRSRTWMSSVLPRSTPMTLADAKDWVGASSDSCVSTVPV
ncbi:hypothetical protein D3C86_2117880 [compost metagenome]